MSQSESPNPPITIEGKASKKKYAILYGYCGTGYQGSQAYFFKTLYEIVEIRGRKQSTMIYSTDYTRLAVFRIRTTTTIAVL